MQVCTDSVGSVICKITKINIQGWQSCVTITVWACLAFQKRATYIQTKAIFDIKVSSVQLTGKKRPPAPGEDERILPPGAWGVPQSLLVSKGPGDETPLLGTSEHIMTCPV